MSRRSSSLDRISLHISDQSGDQPHTHSEDRDGDGGAADGEEPETADRPLSGLERIVAEAMAMAAAVDGNGPEIAELVNQYWRLVPDAELGARGSVQMLEETRHHLRLAEQRLTGQLNLAVEQEAEHTALLIVTDDMPFLVDSLTAAVTALGLELRMLAHPQVVVRREAMGKLADVLPLADPDAAGPGEIVESWMRIEVPPLHDDEAVSYLRSAVQRVLMDVREAVEDWPKMRTMALALADEISSATLPVPEKDVTDSVELLRWLADDHFTFLGYQEYRMVSTPDDGALLEAAFGTGLGILRRDPSGTRRLSSLSPEAAARVQDRRLLVITKANSRSTVHRSTYLDDISFKTFDEAGRVVGERRFLGLFSSGAYRTSVRDLPVVRRKVAEVVARSGLSPRGHSGKELMKILEEYPREELFQIATEDLFRTVMGVLRIAGRRQVRAFARKDQYGRFMSCLVYLPRDRFTTANRLRIQEILLAELNGIGVDYTTRVSDATLARIHFIVRTNPTARIGEIDADALSSRIAEATRLWDDDFGFMLEEKLGEVQGRYLFDRYRDALPETYKDSHTAHEAVQDMAMLELLEAPATREPGELVLHLFRRRKKDDDVRFKIFRNGEPMMLSDVLPVLHSLGVRVSDERPYEVRRSDGTIYVYDFGLDVPPNALELADVRPKVENAFAAAWRGESEVDRLNELVLLAGLTWRQVVVLRAYAKYLRQTGTIFSQEYMESTLTSHPEIAARLVTLFETRFDPALGLTVAEREAKSVGLITAIRTALDAVASLDQDRILRSYLTLIVATLRTSFFQRTTDGRPKSYVALKLDPKAIPDLPAPRPKFEIFVYSPRFEGVHLRFGAVARGGLRWSDRREDFRTEVLGLVKAQMVKNAVIVPVGAKGGFVVKPPAGASTRPAAAPLDRDAVLAEGIGCYRRFVSALLDVTDNLVSGEVVPPVDVVRHDADDPYLVVAADKGTATFSDIANEISLANGFWLGDAFASGGSAGYDHKGMGITARGAWESVKRHAREMGLDTQAQDFTMVGIGDMSGDVFGNGALLSKHARLVAAFDHRHIFIDPSPDATSSYVERRRLFDLPRSSWHDYNRDLISAGGGVWPRTAKAIPVNSEIRAALGIDDPAVTTLAPAELIRAILRAPVDLLFNGGIGTYVKSQAESHANVGDKANDGLRVNGAQVRARIIGEGGNLGFTQRGRVEYALRGGSIRPSEERAPTGPAVWTADGEVAGVRQAQICTDFIDNSAGVDTSDHEVNIKILLGAVETLGRLSRAERDALLAGMTEEVAQLVLRNNYDQVTALGNARKQTRSLLTVHRRMLTEMERAGQLDRAIEAVPTDEELMARASAGDGLTSPELGVLLAYTKINLERDINRSTLPDDTWTRKVLVEYFPTPLRERFADDMAGHRLRREIVTTAVVNEVVNRGGISFVFRAMEETGANAADVIRAFVVVREVYGLPALWRSIEELDNLVPADAQTYLLLEIRRLVDRAVRRLVTQRRAPIDVAAETARLRPGISSLLPRLEHLFYGREKEALLSHVDEVVAGGIPREVALPGARVMYSFGLLDIVELAEEMQRDVADVADVYFLVSERFGIDALLSRISALPREDRWQSLARMALRYDLYTALTGLTRAVLISTGGGRSSTDRVDEWERRNASVIDRARNAMGDFADSRADLAALSVVLRQIRTMVGPST
jgi:glutamate dehydrogenase